MKGAWQEFCCAAAVSKMISDPLQANDVLWPGVQLEDTVWGQLGKSPAEVDYEILEDEFAAKQAVMQIGKGGGAQQRPKQAMLLPLQRAQNVGVFLTRLKMGPAEVSTVSCRPDSIPNPI